MESPFGWSQFRVAHLRLSTAALGWWKTLQKKNVHQTRTLYGSRDRRDGQGKRLRFKALATQEHRGSRREVPMPGRGPPSGRGGKGSSEGIERAAPR
eukprot:4752749-Pyramimonas_sp.AAC.1